MNRRIPKPAEPEPNKIAGSQAPLGNSQAGSSSFPFVFVARARTYRAGREAELLVLGFPSGAWETAKSLHDLSKVNCLETNGLGLPSTQRGISLVMSMIFLSLLILVGTSAMMGTNLEERMAGNTRNRDLAFQAAEAALKHAESTLTSWRAAVFDGTDGLLPYDATRTNDREYWGNTYNWTSSYRTLPDAQKLNQVAAQPKYVVQRMPKILTTEYYRVTARGVGGDSNAVVILQALYTYTPP
jgi:type IV pilus assembly protein PilX